MVLLWTCGEGLQETGDRGQLGSTDRKAFSASYRAAQSSQRLAKVSNLITSSGAQSWPLFPNVKFCVLDYHIRVPYKSQPAPWNFVGLMAGWMWTIDVIPPAAVTAIEIDAEVVKINVVPMLDFTSSSNV